MSNVSYIIWTSNENGDPVIIKTYSDSHRSKDIAEGLYASIIDAMKAGGYVFDKGDCDGLGPGSCVKGKLTKGRTTYFCVVFNN